MNRFCTVACIVFLLAPLATAQQGGSEKRKEKPTKPVSQVSEERRLDIEFELKKLEMEVAIAEATAEDAHMDVEIAELELAKAREAGEGYRVAQSEVHLKQARIRARGQQLRMELSRIHLEQGKVRASHLLQSGDGKPEPKPAKKGRAKRSRGQKETKPVAVRFEVVEDKEDLVIRGPSDAIERVRKLIEAATKRK